MKKYIICYDISNNKIRAKFSKILLKYGIRTQKSFFEAVISERDLNDIKNEIKRLINQETDVVYIFPVDKKLQKKILRAGRSIEYMEIDDFYI